MSHRHNSLFPLLIALLGASIVLSLASVTDQVAGSGLPADEGAQLVLPPGGMAEWHFVTETRGLSGIRIWLDRPAPVGAELEVVVGERQLSGLAFEEHIVSLNTVKPEGTIDLSFPPLRASSSPHVLATIIEVRLKAIALKPGEVIVLRAGHEPGSATARPAFQPCYEVRPFDTLWPISRMGAGRPGVFGWPPFYALMAYVFLILLSRVLIAGYRTAKSEKETQWFIDAG